MSTQNSSDDLSERIRQLAEEENSEKKKACAAQGHPYPERALTSYCPGHEVLVECTGCRASYNREATPEEIAAHNRAYSEALGIEFLI